jgi:hypothetical protein
MVEPKIDTYDVALVPCVLDGTVRDSLTQSDWFGGGLEKAVDALQDSCLRYGNSQLYVSIFNDERNDRALAYVERNPDDKMQFRILYSQK